LLRDAGLYNDALNRLYYALYHAVTALLLTSGIEPRRHRALPGLLGTHFAGTLSPTDLATVARAATWRDLADYERTWEANAEVTLQAFQEIEPLMHRVRARCPRQKGRCRTNATARDSGFLRFLATQVCSQAAFGQCLASSSSYDETGSGLASLLLVASSYSRRS
jgi:uncharacterized protein (UPF0332 family)